MITLKTMSALEMLIKKISPEIFFYSGGGIILGFKQFESKSNNLRVANTIFGGKLFDRLRLEETRNKKKG